MNALLSLAKKVPLWGWITGIVIILILWQSLSGWAMSRKLYSMVLDNLRQDQSQAIKDKDAWIKSCEKEIGQLANEKAEIEKKKAILEKKDIASTAEITRLVGRNNELQNRLNNIVTSDDPDRLLEDLRSRGINIKRYPR